ncbi:hypothetical protein PLESTB_001530000 [Pleodorina starrii]|uniref:ATP synthase mitochondrial F1 complex assembly factor 2 n=1 Tax=Pleodorina starrii TaxID=330485 RepID=A0A9W6BXU9_9CHLO|nr:hypothetical protein PLESTM_001163600 [Pleodorina starrii]GLC59755.1 hypothetical protein PLESTB_001530000 [Pleodorina starrii]GLC75322.1 hypothetical protein PLESTF_001623800 [Pleodorina starrii]
MGIKGPIMASRCLTDVMLRGAQPACRLSALLPHLFFCRQAHTDVHAQKPSRFYKAAHVTPAPDNAGYQLMLDSKPVKTPGKRLTVLPTLPLALAVAAEWEWQDKGKPQLHTMPMMSLVAHALDQPRPLDKVIAHILNYVHTDAACCLYEEGALAQRQRRVFVPILEALHGDLGWRFVLSDSIAGSPQTDALVEGVRSWLAGLDPWHLAAAEQLTTTCKSVVLAAALLRGHIGPAAALAAARLEEDFQAEEWGRVEAGHDLDEADLRSRVFGPSLFVRLLQLR